MAQRKILIINGHPDENSFNTALAEAYKKGAISSGAEVQELTLRNLSFNWNLAHGYNKRTELEPDLLAAQEKIKWADHLVWIYPVWWGSYPALLKGFIDRTFLPGFAFQKRPNSVWWDKLLTNKSARIICTLDQPAWYYYLYYGQPSTNAMKKLTLNFCGISPVGVSTIGPIRLSKEEFRIKYLQKIEKLGKENA